MIAEKTTQPATDQLLNIQKQQAGTQQPNIPVSVPSNQDIVINNKTENITRNNVYVPADGGGQGQVSVRGKVEGKAEQDLGKFKSWLNNEMARQEDVSEARQREYRKRNTVLEKTHNKLSRILNNFSNRIDASLEKNNVKGITSSFKHIFILLGLATFAENWTNLVESVNRISNRVTNLFGSLRNDLSEGFSKEGQFTTALVKLLGGKEDETVGQALRNLLFDEEEGIFGYVKKLISNRLEERSEAISKIEKPDLSIWSLFSTNKAIGSLADYLSKILQAIVSPGKLAGEAISDIAKDNSNKYIEKNEKLLEEQYTDEGFIVPGVSLVRVAKNDKAIVEGTYKGLKRDAVDQQGNLTDHASSYVSQSADIKRNIDLASSGEINTASIGTGFERLYKAAENKEVIPVHIDFVNSLLPNEEDRKKIGIEEPVKYNYIVRPKTQEETELNKRSKYNYTIELRDPKLPRQEHEIISTKHPLVYELTKEQIKQLAETFTGKSNLEINVNNKEFISSIDDVLKDISEKEKVEIKSTEVNNINNLFSTSDLVEQHRKEERTMLDNSRMSAAAENAPEAFSEIKGYFNEIYDHAKQAWGDDTKHTESGDNYYNSDYDTSDNSSSWSSAVSVWDEVDKWDPSSVGSFTSGLPKEVMDRIIKLSETDLFYSDGADTGSDGLGVRGKKGPWSKNGHGYLKLGKNSYKGKCTSGPATFYHDGTKGKIDLNPYYWNTGHPYDATGTRLGEIGFKKVWWGTKDEGYDINSMRATNFEPQPGDIMFNFAGGLLVTNSHRRWNGSDWVGTYTDREDKFTGQSSHVQMWNGTQWVSDTYQGSRSWAYNKDSSFGRLGNESCQVWRLGDNINIPELEESPLPSTNPIDNFRKSNIIPISNELGGNNGLNFKSYSYNSLEDINNFSFTGNENSNLASLSFTNNSLYGDDIKEGYNKIVDVAYSSLDNISSKIKQVITNEALHVDTTNNISDQV